MKRQSAFGLKVIVVIGVALIVGGILLHWALPRQYEKVEILPIVVGSALAIFAAYYMDPKRAVGATDLITSAGGKVVKSYVELRTGAADQKGESVVRAEVTSDPEKPNAPDQVRVQVAGEGGAPAPTIQVQPGAEPPALEEPEPVIAPLMKVPAPEKGDL